MVVGFGGLCRLFVQFVLLQFGFAVFLLLLFAQMFANFLFDFLGAADQLVGLQYDAMLAEGLGHGFVFRFLGGRVAVMGPGALP